MTTVTSERPVFGRRDPVITMRAVHDAVGQTDRIDLELVPDSGHFVVDERPELVADRLLPPARCRQGDSRLPVHPMLYAVDDDPPPMPLAI